MSTRILLADDHNLMREGLRSVLEQDLHLKVVGQASNGIEAVAIAKELHPDAVVMDVHMPVLNGIEATKEIRGCCESTKIVALSMESDRSFISRMFTAGAHAYVIKHSAVDELSAAIRTVLSGRRYISAEITDVVLDDYIERISTDAEQLEKILTPKERQVLQLIAEGHSTKEIGEILFISISTVDTHRKHLLSKLHTDSIAGLTKAALRLGLTEL